MSFSYFPTCNAKTKKGCFLLLGAIVATFFVLFFSYSTSPLYPFYYGGDSAQFLTVGKAWANGKIPYRDMFDHKGPFIFFVDMIGFSIAKSTVGVMIIQVLFLLLTMMSFYKIAMLYCKNTFWGFIFTLLSVIAMKANYCEGNSVEEYCLSFLCWSMYGMLKYLFSIRPTGVHLKEDSSMSNRHNPLWAVFYGITASICFLTRITNYVAITMLLIAIIIRLILKKEFINLFQNAIGYLGGVFAITAPFAAYFYLKGCFNDFLFGTFFFNIEYSDKVKAFAEGFIESLSFSYFFQSYFTFGIVFVIAVIRFFKRDYYIAVTFLCSGMIEAYLFVNGSSFVQYPLVCIAQVPIFLGELYTIGDIRDDLQRYYGYSLYVISMFLTMLFICNIFSNDMVYVADLRKYYSTADSYTWKSLVDENIPEAEKDSFVAYGDNSLKGAYLLTDTLPACKYFTIQEWHALFSDKVSYDITAVYEKCQAKWILAYGPTSHIQKTLDEEYYVYDTKDDYYLYCLK